MSSRFGGASPAQTYATKVRWLVGCLLSVVLVLAIAIIIIAQNTDAKESDGVPVAQPVFDEGIAPTIDVLVAVTRVEEGTRLTAQMFNSVPMDTDKTPMAVVRAQDREAIIGKFAKRLVNSNTPLVMDDITENPPINNIQIPPGYRAATITVDSRSGVDGFAKPNSRVDVLWTYTQDGRKKVATIARFVKILSVAGETGGGNKRAVVSAKSNATTVTMLVTERDAKKIELARTLGSLTLSLVGEQETSASGGEPDSITIADLIGRPASTETAEVANDGVMYTLDPRTGRQVRYVLRNGRWSLDRSFAGGE